MKLDSKAIHSVAHFSKCKQYRYTLVREFESGQGTINFILLNPSTADEKHNDPTIYRCEKRAIRMGFNKMAITNLYPFRSPSPKVMFDSSNPRGEKRRLPKSNKKKKLDSLELEKWVNNFEIRQAAESAEMVICAWGCHAKSVEVEQEICSILRENKIPIHILELSKQGRPKHPLYLRDELEPLLWQPFALEN